MSAISDRTAPVAPPAKGADVFVLAACLAVMLWKLGAYGLYEPHEGHFAGVGREMLLSGDWITPHLNGSPYLNKPPLMYWLVALSNKLFGVNEWASRLPGALFGWATVVTVWAWCSRLWGRAAGRAAAAMLAVAAGWFIFTHQLMIDALLTFLTVASLYAMWLAVREPHRGRRWLVFYLVCALGLLAKGPGAIFPLLAGVSFVVVRRRWDLLKQARLWWGIPLALAPVLAWGVLIELRNPGFARHVFENEFLNRLQDKRWPPDYKVSQVSWYAYLGVTAIWCAPWTVLLPWVAPYALRASKGNESGGANNKKDPSARADGVLILALGALWPVLLFLPIGSRLVYYCLPAVPFVAALAAGWWFTLEAHQHKGASPKGPGVLLLALGAVVFSAGLWAPGLVTEVPEIQHAPATIGFIPWMAFLLGAAMLISAFFLLQDRARAGLAWLCLLMGLANMMAAEGLVAFQGIRTSKQMVADLDPKLGPAAVWVSEGSNELGASAGIAYYLGADENGKAHTVRVMTDDERRPQPQFGKLPRDYETTLAGLNALWQSDKPVVFVTDLMRKPGEWDEKNAPHLPENAGEPVGAYGFRKVYANEAARKRLAAAEGK